MMDGKHKPTIRFETQDKELLSGLSVGDEMVMQVSGKIVSIDAPTQGMVPKGTGKSSDMYPGSVRLELTKMKRLGGPKEGADLARDLFANLSEDEE